MGFLVVFPTAFAINATHRVRTVVEAADLGRPYERVSFTTADRDSERRTWHLSPRVTAPQS